MTHFNRIIYAIRIVATQTSEYVAVLYEYALGKNYIITIMCCRFSLYMQIFVVQLTSATGGAALLDYTQATITILGNDNPFGIISLQSPSSITSEVGDNGTSLAMISVIRE